VLVDVRNVNPDELVEAMKRAGMRSKRQPAVLLVGDQRIIQLLYQAPGTFLDIQIDVLLADSAYQKEALTRAKPAKLDSEREIAVLFRFLTVAARTRALFGGCFDRERFFRP
jgi:hypothetical protein